ncbi:MAG: DUF4234 domain-containing protein [Patescibacteria group bacterium]
MKKQSPLLVFILPFLTFGIYSIFWFARTRGEMVRKGASIPTTWLIIIPIIQLWYYWKWSVGVNTVTQKLDSILVLLVILLLGPIGSAIVQDSFNKVADGPTPTTTDPQPVADASSLTPDVSPVSTPSTPEITEAPAPVAEPEVASAPEAEPQSAPETPDALEDNNDDQTQNPA